MRRGRRTRDGSRTRRASTATCARSSCARSPTQQARATHRRARRRHLAGVRRERQVSLLPRQHRLRSADRLGRDERRRSPVAALGLSRGAQRERAVAAPARNGRRARWRSRAAREARFDSYASTSPASVSEYSVSTCPPADYGDLAAGPAGIVLLLGAGDRGTGRPRCASSATSFACSAPAADRAARRRSSRAFARTRSRPTGRSCSTPPAAARARAGASSPTDRPARVGDGAMNVAQLESVGRSARRVGGDLPRRRGATSATSSTTPRCTAPTGKPCWRSTSRSSRP